MDESQQNGIDQLLASLVFRPVKRFIPQILECSFLLLNATVSNTLFYYKTNRRADQVGDRTVGGRNGKQHASPANSAGTVFSCDSTLNLAHRDKGSNIYPKKSCGMSMSIVQPKSTSAIRLICKNTHLEIRTAQSNTDLSSPIGTDRLQAPQTRFQACFQRPDPRRHVRNRRPLSSRVFRVPYSRTSFRIVSGP